MTETKAIKINYLDPAGEKGTFVTFEEGNAFEPAALKAYLEECFAGYEADPADSDYQRGFLAAILAIRDGFFPNLPVPDGVRGQALKR